MNTICSDILPYGGSTTLSRADFYILKLAFTV